MSDRFAERAGSVTRRSMVEEELKHPLHSDSKTLKPNSCVENLTPFVLMIALGVHALFEGIAVGIEDKK